MYHVPFIYVAYSAYRTATDAVQCLQQSVDVFTTMGKFIMAAKNQVGRFSFDCEHLLIYTCHYPLSVVVNSVGLSLVASLVIYVDILKFI